jgi:hypothetical protein
MREQGIASGVTSSSLKSFAPLSDRDLDDRSIVNPKGQTLLRGSGRDRCRLWLQCMVNDARRNTWDSTPYPSSRNRQVSKCKRISATGTSDNNVAHGAKPLKNIHLRVIAVRDW